MSVQEASQHATLPTSVKPEAKPRPEIPPKPSPPTSSPPLDDKDSTKKPASGKVQSIVDRFSRPEEQPTSGPSELATRKPKNPPTVKPKPRTQLSSGVGKPPPLPVKKKKSNLPKQEECVPEEQGDCISAAGDRSAPDGKEVEILLNAGIEVEAEHSPDTPQSPCCDPGCSCVCHLQRPGMKLIWVRADLEDGEGEDETDEEDQRGANEEDLEKEDEEGRETEGESTAGDEVNRKPVVEESEVKQQKEKLKHSLNILISEGQRRRSDPGPPSIINSLSSRSQSPPIPPKQTQSPPVHQTTNEDDEESIYEVTLPTCDLPKKTQSFCQDVNIPPKVLKPARRSKLDSSASEPTPDSKMNTEPESSPGDVPPAIPPRMPTAAGSRSPNVGQRGGVALPQPTLEEWRAFLPLSNNGSTATVPPGSPRLPCRPPPPPPKTDPRRLSSASAQSLTLKREEEVNGEREEEKDTLDSGKRGPIYKWKTRLEDEPLYQTYRDTVIKKEIKRQTVSRNISKTSMDFQMEFSIPRSGSGSGTGLGLGIGNGPPKSSPVVTLGQSTLWQDLPAVRESGVLERLTSEQCKYQESMFEVLTSEASYFRSLRVLTEHFMDSKELEETIIIMDKKTLFSNILKIREISERFLKDLEDRIFEDVVFSDICDIIYYHAQHNFPAFIDYVRNQVYQEQIFTKLMKTNMQFATVITRLQESPQCQRLPFVSFLLLPFQRITRIKMLIENILRRTEVQTKAEEMASKALASVSKIIDECNSEVGKMKQVEELIKVSQTLEFDKLKIIPIISQNRYLEKKGELHEMSKGGTIFNLRAKFNPIHLFLFNDLLLITVKKGAERFLVVDHAHRSLVQVQPLDEAGGSSGPYEHCFTLTLLENHQGRSIERLIKAPTQPDMMRWMAAFPNPTNPDTVEDEVIYDDWDCPQVQCVEQYLAQQADELDLEPTDIINVFRKTNEGWYEGSRLSDGQKGWFPAANVIEITNEHVRRRNLRERYRVIQAASRVSMALGNTY